MRKPGPKPSKYTTARAEEICKRLADGETLRAICRTPGMPDEALVRRWALDDHKGFAPLYDRARKIGYFGLADDILEISDDGTGDVIRDREGNAKTDHENVHRSRLRVDSRKWILAKMLPKIYGDKVAVTGTVSLADIVARSIEKENAGGDDAS